MGWVDWLCAACVIGGYALVIWNTHRYLNPPPLHKRPGLNLFVRNGVIHFKSTKPNP